MNKALPEYVPITEVAAALGVSTHTVRRWIRGGDKQFGGVKLGDGTIRVRRQPWERFKRGDDIPAPVIDLSSRRRPRRRTS